MNRLPVLYDDDGALAIVDPDTGEWLPVRHASDRALAHAAAQIAELDRETLDAKRTVAAELRTRHGVGKANAGGYEFTIAESQTWPAGPTQDALARLVGDGLISEADAARAMPSRPRPDVRQLKALAGRLAVTDPDAARVLVEACTVSPASVRSVQAAAVDAEAEAA